MAARESLHSLINMLADFGAFAGRKVTIEVTNDTDVKCSYFPPLGENSAEVCEMEKLILGRTNSRPY